MRKIRFIIVILFLYILSMSFVAHAGHVSGHAGSGTLGVVIQNDNFSFGNVTVSVVDQHIAQIMPRVRFKDERDVTDTFTLTMYTTNFVSEGSNTYTNPYTNMTVKSDEDNTIVPIGGSSLEGLTLVHTSQTAFIGTGNTSNAVTLVSGDERSRIDRWEIYPKLILTVPARQDISNIPYEATMTLSIQ